MDVLSLPVNSGEIGVKHSVVFKDLDGTILKETSVKDGKTAAAPSDPSLIGYEFIGWDKDLTNIKEDTVFTACYKPINYSITYVSNLEKVVKTSFGSKEQFIEEINCSGPEQGVETPYREIEESDVESVMNLLKEINEPAYVIGKVTNSGEVDLKW